MVDDGGKHTKSQLVAIIVGIILVVIGVWSLCALVIPSQVMGTLFNIFRRVWRVLWPLALIAAGIYILWGVKTGKFAGFKQRHASRPLRRSRTDRRLLGVCGGIAYYFGVDSTVIRVIAIILLFLTFIPTIVAYFLLAILIPQE